LKISSIHKIFVESSEWNQENLFCGWYDADLSEKGVEEAIQAAKVGIYLQFNTRNYFVFSGLKTEVIHLI
jgi:bisphosphoglycerate-dependent phosphoglycerate mutase